MKLRTGHPGCCIINYSFTIVSTVLNGEFKINIILLTLVLYSSAVFHILSNFCIQSCINSIENNEVNNEISPSVLFKLTLNVGRANILRFKANKPK